MENPGKIGTGPGLRMGAIDPMAGFTASAIDADIEAGIAARPAGGVTGMARQAGGQIGLGVFAMRTGVSIGSVQGMGGLARAIGMAPATIKTDRETGRRGGRAGKIVHHMTTAALTDKGRGGSSGTMLDVPVAGMDFFRGLVVVGRTTGNQNGRGRDQKGTTEQSSHLFFLSYPSTRDTEHRWRRFWGCGDSGYMTSGRGCLRSGAATANRPDGENDGRWQCLPSPTVSVPLGWHGSHCSNFAGDTSRRPGWPDRPAGGDYRRNTGHG